MKLDSNTPIGSPIEEVASVVRGTYAGITIHDNAPMRLVLLPGDFEGDWDAAGRWAKDQGGDLSSRIDQLVLWQNLRREFQQTYYWSAEQYAPVAGFAWFQNFNNGHQGLYRKSEKLCARAVRRLPLSPSPIRGHHEARP